MASRIYPCRWIVSHVSVQVESLGPGSIRLHRVRRGKPAEHGVQVSRPQVRKARFTIELLPGVAIRTRGAAASPYGSEGVVVCAARQCARAVGNATHGAKRVVQVVLSRVGVVDLSD